MTILEKLKFNLNLDDDGDFFICRQSDPLKLIEQAEKQHGNLLEALEELTDFICEEPDWEKFDPVIKARRIIAETRNGEPS